MEINLYLSLFFIHQSLTPNNSLSLGKNPGIWTSEPIELLPSAQNT